MIPMSSSAPPIDTITFTFFACAAAVSAFTSASFAPRLQSVAPFMTPKAKSRCVILLKSTLVAHVAKLPAQLGRYMTTFVSGIIVLGAPALPAFPMAPPEEPPALVAPAAEVPPAPAVIAAPPAPGGAPPPPSLGAPADGAPALALG